MAWQLWLSLLWVLAAASAASLPGCPDKCGNITIPYPFGIGDGCYRPESDYFRLNCNNSTSPPKPFIGWGNLEVLEASLEEVLVKNFISSPCHERTISINFTEGVSPFTFSQSRNRFTVIGCDIEAQLYIYWPVKFVSVCTSICVDMSSLINGSCPGIGCCQTGIPKGLNTIAMSSRNLSACQTNEYGYAFLGREQFRFDTADLYDANFSERASYSIPLVLDWVAGTERCEEAQKNRTSYACRENSECIESTNGSGYKCKCHKGYDGNPYIGCQDIDECVNSTKNTCVAGSICINSPGDYTCSCPKGTSGDGKREGNGCTKKEKSSPEIKIILGVGLSLALLLFSGPWLYCGLKQRRLMKLREKFFKQNGGLILQEHISLHQGATETHQIFTAKELDKATDNYNESRIVGKGGYGTVYKGILSDGRVIAIKKAKMVDKRQIEQFINEVKILSQINHRNVVKLVGSCLETEVPLLVYEYVSNGTLFHHIHDVGHASSLSWDNRLRIASDTASALAYLHSAASIPIIHRDVKSANILLEDNYTAKVSDFGASRLVPMDKDQITTLVQGTLGYLDPEYLLTSQLTEKSDVYSFGVVLVELLTGKIPFSFKISDEGHQSLCQSFILSMKENCLFEILDSRVVHEGVKEQIVAVAELAKRCLQVKGDERPTMKEVAAELEGLRRFQQHTWVQKNAEEMESSLGERLEHAAGSSTAYDSIGSHEAILEIDMAR